MSRCEIVPVRASDEEALRSYWEVQRTAHRHDREFAVVPPLAHLRHALREPSPYHRRELFLAVVDARPVGTAQLGLSDRDNSHLGDLEVAVLPAHRRRGIGTALYQEGLRRLAAQGRTTAVGEAHDTLDGRNAPGPAFGRAMGCAVVHAEDHLVLRLPVPPGERDRLDRLVGGEQYEVLVWGDRCPGEYVDAYCAMLTRMETDVPLGEVDYRPVEWDLARLREYEERTSHAYRRIVAAARRTDGVFGGYSVLFLPHDDSDVLQDDTLIMPAHRGRRLGLRLKLATLEVVLRDHPERRMLHTWTAPDNGAMHHTNTTMGYRPVERLLEMQRAVT